MRRATIPLGIIILLASGPEWAAASSAPRHVHAGWRRWGSTWIETLDPVGAERSIAANVTPRGDQNAAAGPSERLSNERTFTRWAYVTAIEPIRAQPNTSARRVTWLHWKTEDGFPEIYLLLSARWDSHGQEWIKLRIPMRPNGRTGWVKRDALGDLHVTHTLLVVDRERLTISFYTGGRLRWSAPVAVGKPSTPTPAGRFWIRERFKIEDPSSGYWPYAFGTSDYSTLTDWPGGGVVGIHGPYYEPWAIPGRVSHGCVRLRVADDAWLATHVGLGTPLEVL